MAFSSRRYDDRDDPDDGQSRKVSSTARPIVIALAMTGSVLLLLACLGGIGIVTVLALMPGDICPDEFVGSWKGPFFLRGQNLDIIYTFEKTGEFREQEFDMQGRLVHAGTGRWRFRNGEIEIDFNNGGFENAQATCLDNNTIDYRIVDHTDVAQIGIATTFRRQR